MIEKNKNFSASRFPHSFTDSLQFVSVTSRCEVTLASVIHGAP
jgi:hypothetical protein